MCVVIGRIFFCSDIDALFIRASAGMLEDIRYRLTASQPILQNLNETRTLDYNVRCYCAKMTIYPRDDVRCDHNPSKHRLILEPGCQII
jgi:hypothetical protein